MNAFMEKIEKEIGNISEWTPEERRNALRDCILISRENIIKAARIVGAMEVAGDDLSKFPSRFLLAMRRISSGHLLPDAYIKFDGMLRSRVASLPIQDQKSLADGMKISLVVFREGKTETLSVDPGDLQSVQLKQVFDIDHIRSESEQVAWIESRALQGKPKKIESEIQVHRNKGGIVVSGVFISRKDLAEYLARLS
jgi:hypothetical protein